LILLCKFSITHFFYRFRFPEDCINIAYQPSTAHLAVLVQISDIHIGSLYNSSVFDEIVQEVNSIKPDAIVVTGDLTDEGLLPQFELAKKELARFTCQDLIIIPGNHDYRHTGYLLYKKLFPGKQINDIGEVVVITLSTARPDRDEGEVGYRQLSWMQSTIREFEGQHKKIIVAMHHHLIAIPDTGTDKILILDAGDALRVCLESHVDLVLCGHKHRPWIWNLGPLQIAYAGTASTSRFRGFFQNSYNIIEINDEELTVKLKIVGGESFPLSDLVSNYRPYS
jgi:3',5'-cyclic-AMP phosphodiesterase